jgi:hypothetical protein
MAMLSRCAGCGCAVLLAAIFGSATPGLAQVTITDAATFVGAGGDCSLEGLFFLLGGEGCPSKTPGTSLAEDFTIGPVSVTLDSAATPFGPVASVEGEVISTASGHGAAVSLLAEADYEAVVTPVGAGLVLHVSSVPVTFTANLEASHHGMAFAAAFAGTPFGLSACSPDESDCMTSSTNSFTLSVVPNDPFALGVIAGGGISGVGGFQASADPVLTIADELIPGTDINFRDAFVLDVSPNVTQSLGGGPGPVPEPGMLPSLGGVLVGVLALRARRSLRSRGPAGAR